MTLTQILQKIRNAFYTKSEIDSMGGGISLDATLKSKANITDLLPIGSYVQFAGTQAPTGFLVCNGGAISRTTYSKLFAVIGTTYGSGNGSTTFNLPNLTDRFLQGSTTSGTVKNAGLPNITGSLRDNRWTDDVKYGCTMPYYNNKTGVFYSDKTAYQSYWSRWIESTRTNHDPNFDISMDASRLSSIYGNSSTVQPPALTCLTCIKY